MEENNLMSQMSDMIRKMFHEGDVKRDAGLTTPEDIVRFDNIQYGTVEPKWQMLDVYRPKNITGKLPVILSVHGGGWVYGDKDVYQFYCMSLAQRGFAVVNYSYRLAPEYKYPASFEDTKDVCDWIIANADEYGFDTDHIFGVGDSAGAHMLSMFACALTNPKYAKTTGFELPKDFAFKAIALNCGAFLISPEGKQDMTTQLMGDYLPHGGTKEEFDLISTVNHVTEDFPPVFIMTCPGDFLNEQPMHMIPKLEKLKVPFIYRRYGDKNDDLAHVFHCNIRLKAATLCNDEECEFFRKYL
jgi:acetyl esterase/lipase